MEFQYSSVKDCTKGSAELTQNVYYNICNGSKYAVPHGFWDYALIFSFTSILVAAGAWLAYMLFHTVRR